MVDTQRMGFSQYSTSGPTLLHFRGQTVRTVEVRRKECWNKIISELVVIPATSIKPYDSDEKLTGRLLYKDGQVTHQPHPCNPTSVANASSPSSEHDPASVISHPTTREPSHPRGQFIADEQHFHINR